MEYRIRGYHKGLGDQLMWSTLPKMLHELGHEVYLLHDPDGLQVQPFLNEQIQQLVWDYNPYIPCSKRGIWNAGDIVGSKYVNKYDDFIKNAEAMMGLEPKNSLPKIYYPPNLIPGIEGLIELSSFTLKYNITDVIEQTCMLIMQNPQIKFRQLVSDHQSNPIIIPGIEQIKAKNIFELTDYIYSADLFVSLNSGSHMIAGAIKHIWDGEQFCFLPVNDYDWIWRDKKFILPHVNYLKV